MEEVVETKTGECIWFSSRTGIGFIARDDGIGDIFIHYSNIVADGFKTLKAGDRVSFEIGENHRGEQAVNVRVLKA